MARDNIVPLWEFQGNSTVGRLTSIQQILPLSCLINKLRDKPNEDMQVDEMMEKIYGVYMLDEEFIVDMSSGDIGSVFLTSKGRVITSGDGFLRNGVKTHKQDDSIINELNLKVLERTENRFLRREKIKLSPFRVKQVAMTREHLLILTARGLVWKMDSSNIWILQKFFKTENNTSFSNIAKIKYIQASDIWFIALCEHNEVYAAWLRRRKNSGTANYVIAGASLKPIFQMEEGDSVQDVYISSFRAAIVTTFGNVFLGPCHRLVRCPITERVIKVALNFPHTLCLTGR